MKTYKIEVRGKSYNSRGENAQDAIRRLCNRRLPNGNTWWDFICVKMYDAETRGEQWAQCKVVIGDSELIALAELA